MKATPIFATIPGIFTLASFAYRKANLLVAKLLTARILILENAQAART